MENEMIRRPVETGLPSITIRRADSSDIGQICALELACSQNPWSRAGLTDELSKPDSVFLVLQSADSQIIGFVCSSIIIDELHILEVVIRKNYRGNGLGTLLINHLLSMIIDKNIKRACLEARASNCPAIRLYKNCGFTEDCIRKGYYQDGEDAVLMSRAVI
jgi:ribosomal-protein-alanine N-acetyltransferase